MSKVLVLLAQGFEDMEAITITDILRRAEIEVVTAGLESGAITGSRGTVVTPDTFLDNVLKGDNNFDMIVLPGGQPGSTNLKNDPRVINLIKKMSETGAYIGAICAAPGVLAHAGILDGRKATAYPGTLTDENFPNVNATNDIVVTDGNIITSRGPGTAIEFSLRLVTLLTNKQLSNKIEAALVQP